MPTFRFKNLAVTINPDETKAQRPYFTPLCCLYPSCHAYSCIGHTLIPCHNPSLVPNTPKCQHPCDANTQPCFYSMGPGCDGSFYGCGGTQETVQLTPAIKDHIPHLTEAAQLAALKVDLKAALDAIDKQEKQVAAAGRPQTLEEAKQLEAALNQALEEVASLKKTLK